MSWTSDIISFDLSHESGKTIDVTGFFPVSELHVIRSTKLPLDTLKKGKGRVYDFSVSKKLSLSRFRTLSMLDLGRSDLFQISKLESVLLDEKPRPQKIDLCPPLFTPYGSLDIRESKPIISSRKYADIYRRSLPFSLHTRRVTQNSLSYIKKNKKPIVLIVSMIFLLSLPTLFYVRFLIESSYMKLISLKTAPSVQSAIDTIHDARDGFERANILFFPFRIIPSDTLELAGIAIDGGRQLTRWISTLVSDIPTGTGWVLSPSIITSESTDIGPSFRPISRDIFPFSSLGIERPTSWLRENRSDIVAFQSALVSTSRAYMRAENKKNPKAQEIAHIGQGVDRVAHLLEKYLQNESQILALLWWEVPERFIVFNQNRDEIRANGGFPGSILSFTTSYGNILDFRTDDVYYYDWNLYPAKEIPPPWLSLLTDNYGLRDVNYYPDFRDTLEKANAFIEKSGDATVTVGIALNQGIVEKILEKVGDVPVFIWGSGNTNSGTLITFTSRNFSALMSTLTEMRYGEKVTSKDTLFAFIHALASKIHEKRDYAEVIDIVEKAFSDGEILIASRDDGLDYFLSKMRTTLPWEETNFWNSGSIVPSKNWVYPVLTSVSGNKSDRLMSRTYTSETKMLPNCEYENTLTLTHTHGFDMDAKNEVEWYLDFIGVKDPKEREKMLFIQGNGENKTFLRIYAPLGAKLTQTSTWVDVIEDTRKTEFSFLLSTPVGWSTKKTFRYTFTIPDCQDQPSPTRWYRQPWLQSTQMKSR